MESEPKTTLHDPPASTGADRLLLLVPTAMERDRLMPALSRCGDAGRIFLAAARVETCGFGLAAAAAMTMRHLDRHRPSQVILAGIAGSLGPECEIGAAYWFDEVVCDGIGVGSEDSFLSAATLGWNHLDEDAGGHAIGDRLGLHQPQSREPTRRQYGLISRCAASANPAAAQAARRRAERSVLNAVPASSVCFAAEDMEGFSLALACRIAGVPISIVRGISNEAGDRNHAAWQIAPAIDAIALELVRWNFECLARGR